MCLLVLGSFFSYFEIAVVSRLSSETKAVTVPH